MNGTRNVLFCLFFRHFHFPSFLHTIWMAWDIVMYFIVVIYCCYEPTWVVCVHKKKERKIYIFWHRGQHIKLMLSNFYYANSIFYWTYLSWFTYFQSNLTAYLMRWSFNKHSILFFFLFLIFSFFFVVVVVYLRAFV